MVQLKLTIEEAENGAGYVAFPPELLSALGLKMGDLLEANVLSCDGGLRLVLQGHFCPGELTIVEDRYGGCYAGAPYIAWPLPAKSIPPDSQGGDIEAGVFCAQKHLCGKGETPEMARQDLKDKCKTMGLGIGDR